jgi:hypothetical protein
MLFARQLLAGTEKGNRSGVHYATYTEGMQFAREAGDGASVPVVMRSGRLNANQSKIERLPIADDREPLG